MPVIETIYIGGGTPSTLDTSLLEPIFEVLYRTYHVSDRAEITIEANPDDLTPQKIKSLRTLPVNRLSMGVQTFDDGKLRLLHRRHNGEQAIRAVHDCQDAGFDNISIDLIYAFRHNPSRMGNGREHSTFLERTTYFGIRTHLRRRHTALGNAQTACRGRS